MSTLYRKYRPSTFADVTEQHHIITTLKNEIANDAPAHSYLFAGPRGVGKTTTARLLAKALNCEQRKSGQAEPCNECPSCTEITRGQNIDVIEIDAASHTGVDNVRENIIDNAQFRPTKSKYKIFIIDEVHMLSTSAFNALLKTLEEPPAYIVFILATTELHKLPATIVSRCERFQFHKIPSVAALKRLTEICRQEQIQVDEAVLARIVKKSEGGLRDAESLLGQVLTLNREHVTLADVELLLPPSEVDTVLTLLTHIFAHEPNTALDVLNNAREHGASIDQLYEDLIEVVRHMLTLQAGAHPTDDYGEITNARLAELAKKTPHGITLTFAERAIARRALVRNSPAPELPLELLIAEFAFAPETVAMPTPPALLAKTVPPPTPVPTPTITAPPIEIKTESTLGNSIKQAISHFTHPQAHTPVTVTKEKLSEQWEKLLAMIDTTNHSLIFILKMCTVLDIDQSGIIHTTVPYTLHKEKIEEGKNRKVIETCLERVFGEKLSIQCTVLSEARVIEESPSEELNLLAADFGGEVLG